MSSNVREFNDAVLRFSAELVPAQAVAFHRAIAIDAATEIITLTPVDTGRLRANWQQTVESPAEGVLTGVDRSRDGDATQRRAQSALRALRPFSVSFLSNNLPYVDTVENGGFVPKNPENSEKANARRAKRRSKALQGDVKTKFGDAGAPLVADGYSRKAPQGMVAVALGRLSKLELDP